MMMMMMVVVIMVVVTIIEVASVTNLSEASGRVAPSFLFMTGG